MSDKKITKVNIRQMAKIAGVSVATISRAMNPETSAMLAPKTLERINKLVKEHGYTPNLAAKHLSQPKTKTIGVVLPYVHNIFYSSYYTHIMSGVANALIDTDYQFKLILLKPGMDNWDNYNFGAGEAIEGLVLTHWFRFFTDKSVFDNMDIPCVLINDYEDGVNARFVCEDGFSGGRQAAEHLINSGHIKIGLITGAGWSRDSKLRIKGFKDYCNEVSFNVSEQDIKEGDFDDVQKTYKAVDELIAMGKTAIFCANDNMAFMTIERLKEKGLSCPQDISVVGYDNDFRAADYDPAVTTVAVPVYEIAEQAVNILFKHLSGQLNEEFKGNTWVPVELLERDSVQKI